MKFHSTKILILIIICNIAALAGYYFLFQYIKTQSKAALSLTNTLDQSQQKNGRLSSMRSAVKDTENARQQLVTFLISIDEEIPFVEQVEALVKNSGLVGKTNNMIGGTKTKNVFKMQLETSGSWNNTMFFLSQLENLPYDIYIGGVNLNKTTGPAKKGVGPVWTTAIEISVSEKK